MHSIQSKPILNNRAQISNEKRCHGHWKLLKHGYKNALLQRKVKMKESSKIKKGSHVLLKAYKEY
jgi:hypothetical protein